MKEYELICEYCGKHFTKKNKPKQKFCSISCGLKNRRIEDPEIYKDGWNHINAYVTGLIWADGCLSYDAHSDRERITIAMEDRDHIEKLRAILTPEKSIYKSSTSNCWSIVSSNINDMEFLKKNGLTKTKSLSIKFPDIPEEFIGSFILGNFDGDGCIYIRRLKEYRPYFSSKFTSGSIDFLDGLTDVFDKHKITYSRYKDKRHNAYYLQISSTGSNQILFNLMYGNKEIYLERKYNKFINNELFKYEDKKRYNGKTERY